MIRRAWLWAFGPGHFGGALIWTVGVVLCVLALPLLALAWLVIWVCS